MHKYKNDIKWEIGKINYCIDLSSTASGIYDSIIKSFERLLKYANDDFSLIQKKINEHYSGTDISIFKLYFGYGFSLCSMAVIIKDLKMYQRGIEELRKAKEFCHDINLCIYFDNIFEKIKEFSNNLHDSNIIKFNKFIYSQDMENDSEVDFNELNPPFPPSLM